MPNTLIVKIQDGGHIEFRKTSTFPDWVKIYPPNLVERCITAICRRSHKQISKTEVNSRETFGLCVRLPYLTQFWWRDEDEWMRVQTTPIRAARQLVMSGHVTRINTGSRDSRRSSLWLQNDTDTRTQTEGQPDRRTDGQTYIYVHTHAAWYNAHYGHN